MSGCGISRRDDEASQGHFHPTFTIRKRVNSDRSYRHSLPVTMCVDDEKNRPLCGNDEKIDHCVLMMMKTR